MAELGTPKHNKRDDCLLGMGTAITRRDFLNTSLLGTGAALMQAAALATMRVRMGTHRRCCALRMRSAMGATILRVMEPSTAVKCLIWWLSVAG